MVQLVSEERCVSHEGSRLLYRRLTKFSHQGQRARSCKRCEAELDEARSPTTDNIEAPRLVEDLFEDLKDGRNLIRLLSVLCPNDAAVSDTS